MSDGNENAWNVHIGLSFSDIPYNHPYGSWIETIFHHQITGGCGPNIYCPLNVVTRGQMGVFMLKAKFGAGYTPPPATGTVFNDVPVTHQFAAWIEELAAIGITGGCGGGNYCPNTPIAPAHMAVFLLKALEGASYDPPDCEGVFADVPCTPGVGTSDWIEEIYRRGVTGAAVTPRSGIVRATRFCGSRWPHSS